jgi:hypothetical protein
LNLNEGGGAIDTSAIELALVKFEFSRFIGEDMHMEFLNGATLETVSGKIVAVILKSPTPQVLTVECLALLKD